MNFKELIKPYKQKLALDALVRAITLGALLGVISSLIYPYCPNIAKSMAEQLSYDLNTKLDDITCDNIKVGHLIDKENIKPVFLRMDSELADKCKK